MKEIPNTPIKWTQKTSLLEGHVRLKDNKVLDTLLGVFNL